MQTDGIASCDNRNEELAMLVAHHISESNHWQHAMNDGEGEEDENVVDKPRGVADSAHVINLHVVRGNTPSLILHLH